MKKLRVGIAGYGVVGVRRHKVIDEHPHLEVVAVCDKKYETTREDLGDIAVYTDFNQLIKHGLDVLLVCLPNDIAPDATIAGLENGLHVFCEKPPGRNVSDIERVRAAEKKHPSLKLKYGFNHRYHESVKEALSLLRSGKFGRVVNIRGVYGKSAFIPWPRPSAPALRESGRKYWRTSYDVAGGGILIDQGIHMVDLMRCFASDFVEVKSFVTNSFWEHEVEDNAYALMQTADGVVAFLHSTATQWRHKFSLEICLEQGTIILSGILSGTKSYGQETLTVVYREDDVNGNPREQTTSYIRDHSWKEEIYEFADAILNNKPIEVGSSYDALKTMELVFKIYHADPAWKSHLEALETSGTQTECIQKTTVSPSPQRITPLPSPTL